jgi:hypothetical protein
LETELLEKLTRNERLILAAKMESGSDKATTFSVYADCEDTRWEAERFRYDWQHPLNDEYHNNYCPISHCPLG